ncbi:MAG: sugar phosphate isomerase/epimerase family protein, partial [Pirellulaceae bacterium]
MTLGFSTYGMKSLTTERAIKSVARLGFDAIEICVIEGWDADGASVAAGRREAIGRQLVDSGLRLTALMEHVHPETDSLQHKALERLKIAAGLAHAWCPAAPPLIQTTLGSGQWSQVRAPLRDRLGAWIELAEAEKVVLAIKPHRGGAMSQPADAVWLIEQLGRPDRLKMVYDYSHYAYRDLSIEATVATALPYTAHVAVKDAIQENQRVLFRLAGETGALDFPRILRLLAAGGYRGDVNCEVSGMVSSQPGYDPLSAAKICYTNMSRAFEQAGVARA